MADWSLLDREWLPAPPPAPYDPFQYADYDPYYQGKQQQAVQAPPPAQPSFSPPSPTLALMMTTPRHISPMTLPMPYMPPIPRGDNPREIRNKAEKQRRDKLNQSIAELASMVPPVVGASRKIDKTGVLRLTAHYLRAHQYVFGDSITYTRQFSQSSTKAVLGLLNGFLLTTTYKGLVVVVSQNVTEFLGYNELDLLGQNIFNLTHEDDRQILKDNLMPRSQKLGSNGELLVPEDAEGKLRVAKALANEKRRFVVRFKKLGQRSEPSKYVTCHVEGSLRKSDRACRSYNRCCQMVRRARARGDNPCSSGNDVVFIGVVRPASETFINESAMEAYKMEYRTRHSIDGEIIQCEQKIALVTGYMTHEVNGVNAMNFIHRDEVRWVIVALREMYDHNLVFGESCYRLITKNGQFVYMRTRGRLDVDKDSRVTSFVCTNTVVDEREGKQLIKQMKERFTLTENNNVSPALDKDESVPIEDPRQLKKVIMSLVTNLPSPQSSPTPHSPDQPSINVRLAIIPPKRERIVNAIEKIYTVIKQIPKQTSIRELVEDEPDTALSLPLEHSYTEQNIDNPSPIFGQRSSILPSDYAAPYHEEMEYQLLPPNDGVEILEEGSSGVIYPESYAEDANKMNIATNEQQPDRSSPSIESFFDASILNTQIETAIDTLEQSMDPNFPDLLMSNEVQNILRQIEDTDIVL